MCVEPATVYTRLFNPLQIAISLSDIILGCQYSDSESPSELTDIPLSGEMIYGQHDKSTGMYVFENFELERLDELVLEPQEVREVSKEMELVRSQPILTLQLDALDHSENSP